MCPYDELEKYIEFGLSGSLEVKGQEKRYWLGEFRERIVFALTLEQVNHREAIKITDEKLNDTRIDRIVVYSGVKQDVAEKYMDLAKKHKKDFKIIDMQNKKQKIALALVSNEAVNEQNVLTEKMPILPEKFLNARNNKLCKAHMEELKRIAPLFTDGFEEVSLSDRMVGVACGVCKIDENNGVLM